MSSAASTIISVVSFLALVAILSAALLHHIPPALLSLLKGLALVATLYFTAVAAPALLGLLVCLLVLLSFRWLASEWDEYVSFKTGRQQRRQAASEAWEAEKAALWQLVKEKETAMGDWCRKHLNAAAEAEQLRKQMENMVPAPWTPKPSLSAGRMMAQEKELARLRGLLTNTQSALRLERSSNAALHAAHAAALVSSAGFEARLRSAEADLASEKGVTKDLRKRAKVFAAVARTTAITAAIDLSDEVRARKLWSDSYRALAHTHDALERSVGKGDGDGDEDGEQLKKLQSDICRLLAAAGVDEGEGGVDSAIEEIARLVEFEKGELAFLNEPPPNQDEESGSESAGSEASEDSAGSEESEESEEE